MVSSQFLVQLFIYNNVMIFFKPFNFLMHFHIYSNIRRIFVHFLTTVRIDCFRSTLNCLEIFYYLKKIENKLSNFELLFKKKSQMFTLMF